MRAVKKLICLAGATGSGKSAIAARLGRELGGVVVNADSRQVYADFPIITAQPEAEERGRCPHLLYGFLETARAISAGAYARLASGRLRELLDQGVTPIVTGGTGLYFQSLLRGIADIPPVPADIRRKWQEKCAQLGSAELYRELLALDPAYAAKIHAHDSQRVTRALEVLEATGKNFSWWHKHSAGRPRFEYLYLGVRLELSALEPRLERRIALMLEKGALEEARAALERCPDPAAPGWSGIGCAELYRTLNGALTLEEAKKLWLKHTRAYAKRQLTWFKAEKEICWHSPERFANMEALATGIRAG
jgi:tRNA dimethylallyltransferase